MGAAKKRLVKYELLNRAHLAGSTSLHQGYRVVALRYSPQIELVVESGEQVEVGDFVKVVVSERGHQSFVKVVRNSEELLSIQIRAGEYIIDVGPNAEWILLFRDDGSLRVYDVRKAMFSRVVKSPKDAYRAYLESARFNGKQLVFTGERRATATEDSSYCYWVFDYDGEFKFKTRFDTAKLGRGGRSLDILAPSGMMLGSEGARGYLWKCVKGKVKDFSQTKGHAWHAISSNGKYGVSASHTKRVRRGKKVSEVKLIIWNLRDCSILLNYVIDHVSPPMQSSLTEEFAIIDDQGVALVSLRESSGNKDPVYVVMDPRSRDFEFQYLEREEDVDRLKPLACCLARGLGASFVIGEMFMVSDRDDPSSGRFSFQLIVDRVVSVQAE